MESTAHPKWSIRRSFKWSADLWHAPTLEDYVIYEAHIGTLTPAGTFESAISQLERLVDIGVTALEIMPVAEFPGNRNWGYDGAYPFAAQSSYGGPKGLARLVDACHQRGIAVILDVVYNHFGPDGAYGAAVGNYFTDHYRTPWGSAVNFDGPGSDEVRRYFIESALYWLCDLHVDAFRLDAVHAIYDQSAYPFLRQFTNAVHRAARELGRTAYVIAESDLNDPRFIQHPTVGGFGFDAQWSDDLHHALHARLTGEQLGYYRDFGAVADIKRALEVGFVYTGQFSEHRGRAHGAMPQGVRPSQFVVCSQNHDQVGNRATGDRLSTLVDFERLKLAAAAVVLSPFTPILFMGEEYGETAPFQYFTSHTNPDLIEAVRKGRAEEFRSFTWSGVVPDPHDPATFERSKLNPELRTTKKGVALQDFYQELVRLRRELPAMRDPDFGRQEVDLVGTNASIVRMRRWNGDDEVTILLNFSDAVQRVEFAGKEHRWTCLLDSSEQRWLGPVTPDATETSLESGVIEMAASSALVLVPSPETMER